MKTSELTGVQLDWAVAKAEGLLDDCKIQAGYVWNRRVLFSPTRNWNDCGQIIERERMQITPRGETTDLWEAIIFDNIFMDDGSDCFQTGTTPLIAAMRCYVASKLGDEVELPEGL